MQAKAHRRSAQRRSLLVLRQVLDGHSKPTFEPRETPWRMRRPGSSYGRLLCHDLLDDEVVGDALRDVRAASLERLSTATKWLRARRRLWRRAPALALIGGAEVQWRLVGPAMETHCRFFDAYLHSRAVPFGPGSPLLPEMLQPMADVALRPNLQMAQPG